MAAITEKLKYRKSGATTEITLYDLTDDVGSDYLSLRIGGTNVYAKLGLTSDPQATDMRLRKGGTTYAVLLQASEDLPAGFMAFFDAICPSGWTLKSDSNYDDDFVKADSSYSSATGSHTHNHTHNPGNRTSSSYATDNSHCKDGCGTTGLQTNATHTHGVNISSTTTETVDHQPEYVELIVCSKD